MLHHRFTLNLVIRVILLTLTCLAFAFSALRPGNEFITVNIGVVLIIQVYTLMHYLNRVNRDLTGFFGAVANDDSTIIYKRIAPARSFEKLYTLFDEINAKIQKLKIENTQKTFYFQNLVEHAGVGLISYTGKGKIDIYNSAAKNLLKLQSLKSLSGLEKLDHSLHALIKELKPGEQQMTRVKVNDELVPLSIKANEFIIQGETIRLISLQNIKNELEENELLSWQKLIRTLTHEIMNSIGPISSSIKTIKYLFESEIPDKKEEKPDFTPEILGDTLKGLDIIDERAQGLLDFVDKFRSLTLTPSLHLSTFSVKELLEGIKRLFASEIEAKNIHLSARVIPDSLKLTADKQLIEQVVINLITNSIQALEFTERKEIKLNAFNDYHGKAWIQVIDNGEGISEEDADKIFVPFFTTKETGSGIGLNWSRQIMKLHKGKISFTSVPGETVFTVVV
ncbi:MAG: HAMP domain-containing histidine kinase [Bacteroidales bacterium]|nr:HAMP domain-containing histidine kinase [Bacteroidales bacterium]MBN2764086.1 HAMP domain-containing histidine kinase [Bacteroidales bacterium]